MNKNLMYDAGILSVQAFREMNPILTKPEPTFIRHQEKLRMMRTCGFFRPRGGHRSEIQISVMATANIGRGGYAWSHPAYKIDRTAYGVVAHEYGHYVDWSLLYPSDSPRWKELRKNEKVSGYEPNPSEAFAETMRVFIGNPDLLRRACPNRYHFLIDRGLVPRTDEDFLTVLRSWNAPERQIEQAKKWARV
jgi:hypothetical protein